VLDDHGLDAAQRTKLKEWSARVHKRQMEAWRDFGRPSPAERSRQTLRQARTNEAEVNAILTADQQRRLHEIALQLQGPSVFREPEVVAALQLSDQQRERIGAIEEEAFLAAMKKGG